MTEMVEGKAELCGLNVQVAMDHFGNSWVMIHALGTQTMIGVPLVSLPMLIEHLQKIQEEAPAQMEQMRLLLSRPAGNS